MTSYTQPQMRRHRFSTTEKPTKMGQTFFLIPWLYNFNLDFRFK